MSGRLAGEGAWQGISCFCLPVWRLGPGRHQQGFEALTYLETLDQLLSYASAWSHLGACSRALSRDAGRQAGNFVSPAESDRFQMYWHVICDRQLTLLVLDSCLCILCCSTIHIQRITFLPRRLHCM